MPATRLRGNDPFMTDRPQWPTAMVARRGPLFIGTPGAGVWSYWRVPMSPVRDAVTVEKQISAAMPLLGALEALARMARAGRNSRRRTVKGSYRQVHLLLADVPSYFRPPPGHPCHDELREDHYGRIVEDKVLLLGVKLVDRVYSGGGIQGMRDAVDSLVQTIIDRDGVPLEDYAQDASAIAAAMTQAGLREPTTRDVALAKAWFNHGVAADPVIQPDVDCLGIFQTATAAAYAQAHWSGLAVHEWPTDQPGHHIMTMAAVEDIGVEYDQATEHKAQWVTQLMNAGACVVSVRGLLEPQLVTGREVESQAKRHLDDLRERANAQKMTSSAQEEKLAEARAIFDLYRSGKAPCALVDASVVTAFQGSHPDLERVVGNGSVITLNPLPHRQVAALAETFLCSPIRANPHRLDLPATTIALSGIVEQSRVGDEPSNGAALVGFTETDRLPAWFDHTMTYGRETAPVLLAAGASGSGKTTFMVSLADQVARAGYPVVIVDPKVGSDLSEAVERSGGQTVSLDTLLSADGVFDPLRYAKDASLAIDLASSVLLEVNVWGSRKEDMEAPIQQALAYGVGAGARCIGEALTVARAAGRAEAELVDPVLAQAQASPAFRALVGIDPRSQALRVAQGITYIRVGEANLNLPEPGAANPTLPQRTALALIRAMVTASATALAGRDGLVMLDEAWVFLGAGNSELERLARVARSQKVACMLFTQRVSDATLSGIDEHICGGFILPLKKGEAEAACRLLGLEPTPERISRITAGAWMDAEDSSTGTAPNWGSMRFLTGPDGRILRGSIALYADLSGRVVPTEIVIPPSFLARLSQKGARAAAAVGG